MRESEFSEVFESLSNKSNLSDSEIARRLNVNRSTIGRWKSGEQSPPLSKISLIAKLFDVQPAALLGGSLDQESDKEKTLLDKYRMLDDKGRHAVEVVAEMEYRRIMKSHLEVVAARNNDVSEEQIKLMEQDLEDL